MMNQKKDLLSAASSAGLRQAIVLLTAGSKASSGYEEMGAHLPTNFRNADGPLDQRNGRVQGETTAALPW